MLYRQIRAHPAAPSCNMLVYMVFFAIATVMLFRVCESIVFPH